MNFIIRNITPVVVMVSAFLFVFVSDGCASKHVSQMDVLRQGDKYYEVYEAGDVDQARRSLEQLNQLFQSPIADVLEPSGRAGINYFNYARLYALEKRAGNETGAEKALIKARYWNLRRFELSQSATNGVSMEDVRLFNTPEKIEEVADKLDRAATKGKGPNYIQYIQKP